MGETFECQGNDGASADLSAVVFTFRARPGLEQDIGRWVRRVVGAARQYEGNIAATVIGSDEAGEYRVLHLFRDQAARDSWLGSAQRAELLRAAEPFLERPPAVQRTGLETWFSPPSDGRAVVPPPRWKMWVTSVLAIYPLVLIFLAWVSPQINGWPLAVKAAVFPLVLLSLMTYLVMPTVTRLLRPWLVRRS
jgi:uncharacterized protein